MPTALVVCNVLILLDNAPAMLVTRVQNVILLVVVTLLVQAALYVISQQVNVPAILETQEPHVIPVTPTTTEQVLDFAQVRIILCHHMPLYYPPFNYILPSACECNATGSSSLQCANSTGQCNCNAGYKGTNCDTACGCDTPGSSSNSCDQSTGQCTCNTGYTGATCNSCDTKYYKSSDGTCTG